MPGRQRLREPWTTRRPRARRPQLLFINLMDAHRPYDALLAEELRSARRSGPRTGCQPCASGRTTGRRR